MVRRKPSYAPKTTYVQKTMKQDEEDPEDKYATDCILIRRNPVFVLMYRNLHEVFVARKRGGDPATLEYGKIIAAKEPKDVSESR